MNFKPDWMIDLFSQPTSPYREAHVESTVRRLFNANGVPYFLDSIGNIVVGASSKSDYQKKLRQKSKEPLRVFIAHMDHPGFHGVKWESPGKLEFQWHGGAPTKGLKNTPVWIANADGWLTSGKITSALLTPGGQTIQSGIAEIRLNHVPGRFQKNAVWKANSLFGGFQFKAPVWKEGSLYYTKAADDLAGVSTIVHLAIGLANKKNMSNFIGLLTRAEEVGFLGAISHFETGLLQKSKRQVICVSLEASRELPGAEIGKGPIVRLGDRLTVFDAGGIRVLRSLAQRLLPGKHQVRIMDGGACEGTAATAFGLRTIALSVPLGNYHNQGKNGRPAPEYIHESDVQGILTLSEGILMNDLEWNSAWNTLKTEFGTKLKKSLHFF